MQYDKNGALIESHIPGLPEPRRGKVRDIYDVGDALLMVASDRISAFDCVMPNGIPDKGKVLSMMTLFWFGFLDWMPNHVVSSDTSDYPKAAQDVAADLEGRSMLVCKAETVPVECVARGYLVGSGWKEYQKSSSVCGIQLRPGYPQAGKLDCPIFTPAYKAEEGHDENISYAQVIELTDAETAAKLRDLTLKLYTTAADYAVERGIIIADTKFEFGRDEDGNLIVIDEILTPDSSRFWPADQYETGMNPPSLDKQFVRDYLESINFDKSPPAPELPDDVVMKTREKYVEALKNLTGQTLPETSA